MIKSQQIFICNDKSNNVQVGKCVGPVVTLCSHPSRSEMIL